MPAFSSNLTIWPTFLEMLNATPQQASILTHTWATTLATVVGFTAAMVLGTAIAANEFAFSTFGAFRDES